MKAEKCTKTYFVDEKFALEYIEKLNKTSCRKIKPVRAYLCPKCFCWHLTSIEEAEDKRVKFLNRQIENLKSKNAHLENENQLLKLKIDKLKK